MDLAQRIQAKTDNGDTIIDFLVEAMTGERDDFMICHRLDAARLLRKYGWDEATDFIADNPTEPSRQGTSSNSQTRSEFDIALANKIKESTDDGATVCRFLINVMEGELKQFKPHHRISAARELLSRGFGKQAYTSGPSATSAPPAVIPAKAGTQEAGQGGSHSSLLSTHSSEESPNPTNHSNVTPYPDTGSDDHTDWDEINRIVDEGIERSNRILAEQGIDPDNPAHVPDDSVFDEAWENSMKWFEEWKNSIAPEEYQAIIKDTAERFDAEIDLRIERRKQIAEDREQREKEEAERQLRQAKARAKAKEKAEAEAKEEEDLGPPPAREDHKTWSPTPSIPTSFRLVKCGHPKCKLHDGPVYYPEDDRSSPYYNPGYAWPVGPSASTTSAVFDDLMARRRPP